MTTAKTDTYAERLSAAIAAKGATKSALARHLGVSPQALYHLFTGHTKSFTAENNVKAAAFLGVDSAWLATGSETGAIEGHVTQTLTKQEVELVEAFRNLSQQRRNLVTAFTRDKALEQLRDLQDFVDKTSRK